MSSRLLVVRNNKTLQLGSRWCSVSVMLLQSVLKPVEATSDCCLRTFKAAQGLLGLAHSQLSCATDPVI